MRNPDIRHLGQVFTPPHIVAKMLALRQNRGRVLEPACGDGMFLSALESGAVGLEVDKTLNNDGRVVARDFFDYPPSEKFDTIIGNPPYVRHRDIRRGTKALLDMRLFDKRGNLYLFFIAKCIDHLREGGELIFITPRDFIKATSARRLNHKLYGEGSMTHFYDLGDAPVFAGVTPNCAIWRWVKGRRARGMATGGKFRCAGGQIWFGGARDSRLGDYFDVKVGAVSGADDVFINEKRGNVDMVCSATAKDGKTRRVIYKKKDKSLHPHKARLMNRRVRKFDESNWWEWGRGYCERAGARIYVNAKTRNARPFFVSEAEAYDGSVLALFPKAGVDLHKAVETLNGLDWGELGFICGGRFLFTQRSLATAGVAI